MDRIFAAGRADVESALRESEQRHALLFQSAPGAMIAFDVDTLEILAVNSAAVAQYGYSRDELLHMTLRDLRPASGVAPFWRAHAAMRAGHEIHGVYRHRRRDDTLIDVEVRTSTLSVGNGHLRLMLATDVTARMQGDDAARFLDTATSILTSSLEPSFVCRNLAALAVPRLGEWCVVHRPGANGELTMCGFAHADPLKQGLVAELVAHRGTLDASHPAMAAWRDGAPVELRATDATAARQVLGGGASIDDEELLAALQPATALYVPVLGRGDVLAVIECMAGASQPHDSSTVALAIALADRTAIALGNAVVHQETRAALLAATQPAGKSPDTGEIDLASWVFETIPDCFLRVDHEWRITYVNGPAERLMQRPREELIGTDLWTLFADGIGTGFEREYRRAMREQRAVTIEEFFPPLDAWFEAHAKPSGSGLAIFFRDVSAQRRTRAQLEEGEAQFRDFVESATDLIHMLSPDGRVLYANRAWRDALGYTEDELLALTVADIVAPESAKLVQVALESSLHRESPPDQEIVVLRKDGSRLVVRGRANWRFVDGVPVSSRGIYRDVTAEVQVRVLLEKAQRTEAATNRAKTAFLDRMSHEMRTPLTAVIGFADLLEKNRGGRLSPTELDFSRRIGVQGRNLLMLIEDVLAYAEIESRRVDLDVTSFDLRTVLREVAALYAADAERAKVQLSLELPMRPAMLETDPATLRRVMRYLLNDAISRMAGGRLTVTLGTNDGGQPRAITVHARALDANEHAAAPSTASQTELGLTIAESLAEVLGFRLTFGHPARGVTTGVLSLSVDPQRAQMSDVDNSAKTLHAILEASPLPIIAFQPDWTVRLWNRAAQTLYGWTSHDAIERRLPMLRAEDDESFRDLLRRALDAPHGIADVPAVHRRRDGRTVEVHISLAPLRAPDGRLRGFIGIVTDVSERVRLADELRQAQRMEVVGRLAGGIAHDFNNLLTVISAHAQFVLADLPPGDPLADDARAIQESSERAAGLTRQLLLFARKQVPQRRVVDLNRKLANVDRILRRTLGSHVEFVTIPSPDSACVDGDPGQMEQVMMNLILNARDAMPDGGGLVVELSVDAKGERDGASPGTATLTVSDTGIGMDEATRQRIFEPFFTTKGVGRGTGLGLATVYSIVTEMGGRVDVESTVGVGTTFRVRLPLTTSGSVIEAGALDDEGSLLGTETVLLVEDQDAVRAVAARALRAYGYTVLVARHGNDALAILRDAEKVDLLLTDLVMPEMPGQELAARVRALAPEVRVLFMSGYSELPQRQGELDPGAPLVRKPFAADDLARAVREVLDR